MLSFAVDLKAKAGVRAPQVYPYNEVFRRKWPLFRKISKVYLKEFMVTPIHVLCSNFTNIVRRKVGETMRCFGDKSLQCVFFSPPFCAHFAEVTKSLHERVT